MIYFLQTVDVTKMALAGQTYRWQRLLILFVLLITTYNIAPTIIYYSKPLDKPIDQTQASRIVDEFFDRAERAPDRTIEWIRSFLSGLNIQPKSIEKDEKIPTLIRVRCAKSQEATQCEQWIEHAARSSIFAPARRPIVLKRDGADLWLSLEALALPSRQYGNVSLCSFFEKYDPSVPGKLSSRYCAYAGERYINVLQQLFKGIFLDKEAHSVASVLSSQTPNEAVTREEMVLPFAKSVFRYVAVCQTSSDAGASLLQPQKKDILRNVLLASLYTVREQLELMSVSEEVQEHQGPPQRWSYQKTHVALIAVLRDLLNDTDQQLDKAQGATNASEVYRLTEQKNELLQVVQVYSSLDGLDRYDHIPTPSYSEMISWYDGKVSDLQQGKAVPNVDLVAKTISTTPSFRHPLFHKVLLDVTTNQIVFEIAPHIREILLQKADTDRDDLKSAQEFLREEVFRQASLLGQESREQVELISNAAVAISLFETPDAQSFVQLSTDLLAESMAAVMLEKIERFWHPVSRDFAPDVYPRMDVEQFSKIKEKEERKVCLLAVSPVSAKLHARHILKPTSFYVILRGAQKIVDLAPNDTVRQQMQQDLSQLAHMLQKMGFIGYSGQDLKGAFGSLELASDMIFELEDFYNPYLSLTQEHFSVHGSSALLEFSSLANRLQIENRRDDQEQDALVRWKEMWQSAQVSSNPYEKLLVPAPDRNVFFSNMKISMRKYLRGDYNRVVHWGLDLSGGKSVQVGLYDSAMRPVTQQKDLEQAVSELYKRLNNMGVSERVLRIENSTISIDFPGSQDVPSSELIQSSAMYFHIVNEKFGALNKKLAAHVHDFLQEVWDEATLTDQRDLQSINALAAKKLKMASSSASGVVSESARVLAREGLVLVDSLNPNVLPPTTTCNDVISTIVQYAPDVDDAWSTQPLLIVFRNYALEGANLDHVVPSYDPIKGNVLSFEVRTKDAVDPTRINPQEALSAWTSQFCQEAVQGTSLQEYSQGHGWRMAVVVNGFVISAPTLSAPIRESAYISGHFSQRDVQKLARDLEAGSLSFTPKILSEYNVSPELGQKERDRGLMASALALVAVIVIMVMYYRFLGVIASCAVLVNILIIWAVMQNIGAAMTLPALAGLVLTMGMAVDANVLVFERIREELKNGANVAAAIRMGYQRAFTAILDSNLTTLIAALLLIQFDSGPIRGFAITLAIGLISSMFTSLFMTRVYFSGRAEKYGERWSVTMASWFSNLPGIDFLKYSKQVGIVFGLIILAGSIALAAHAKTLFGMDFVGGYALVVQVEGAAESGYKETASKALHEAGLRSGEYHIRELGDPHLLRIQCSLGLNEEGRPFHGMAEQSSLRIRWLVDQLEKGGITISDAEKSVLSNQWAVMTGQLSSAMRNNALTALALSLVAVLMYIAIRFEWRYAASSVLALIVTVLATIASVGIFRCFGFHLQITLEVVGAIMTIIGYALNDTIIVFDRVREECQRQRKKSLSEVATIALNETLSRTIMTSLTTLAVVVMLLLFGGAALFTFAFIMSVGIVIGTFSSLFIAAPLLVYFDRDERE